MTSKTTLALEAAVAVILENRPKDGATSTNRQRVNVDRAHAQIMKLIAPRVRHFVRQYGLINYFEDAEQCCAIAVHRAVEAYEPEKAQFTTFVNWQIRGELQSLRFRVMTDQRPSAKRVAATTVSLNAILDSDGEMGSFLDALEDEFAVEATESAASDYLADGAKSSLIDAYVDHLRKVGMEALARRPLPKREETALRKALPRLRVNGVAAADVEKLEATIAREREILEGRLFSGASLEQLAAETGVTAERVRQITKRATKAIAGIAAADSRFTVMAEAGRPASKRPQVRANKASILLDVALPHNRLSCVVAVDQFRPEEQSAVKASAALVQ
ncbi:sigma-70 family RNA polymerase sigma factor [Sphingomonas sp.]|uniref:sigma-70 family RNA polymerase sigma factor n=1 Tax=Sphingomonas sp. TaxID=28214 RepID=UPI0028B051A4|nr:sigma-70 family RNA polymerase sigma factor [Sphingomonas sp.]